MLGPVLFNCITDYLNDGTECAFGWFVDDRKPVAVADTLHWCVAIQKNTDSLQKWTDRSLMMFNKRKQSPVTQEEQPQATVRAWAK